MRERLVLRLRLKTKILILEHEAKRVFPAGGREEINMNNIAIFIEKLIETNSKEQHLLALYELLRVQPEILSPEDTDRLLALFQKQINKKSQSSKNNITKRWQARKTKGTDINQNKWSYILRSPYSKACHQCGEKYQIEEPIFINNLSTPKAAYHSDCAPKEAKDQCSFYQRQMAKENK